jgi:hypothetical protein
MSNIDKSYDDILFNISSQGLGKVFEGSPTSWKDLPKAHPEGK